MYCSQCGNDLPPPPPPVEAAEIISARAYRWHAGLVEMSPPARLETTTQRAHRKAQVRHWYETAVHKAFGIAASHLGKFEASRLLLQWALALAKHFPAGKGKNPDEREDDYVLEVVEAFGGSPRKAAQALRLWHDDRFGPSELAIERSIERLRERVEKLRK
jgi:hypothetical protein